MVEKSEPKQRKTQKREINQGNCQIYEFWPKNWQIRVKISKFSLKMANL